MDELRRLLRWARRNGLCIEIQWDGWTRVQEPSSGVISRYPYKDLASGKTLLQALRSAKKILEAKKKPSLSLDEVWNRCLAMWRDVVRETRLQPESDVPALKRKWIQEHYPDDAGRIYCDCYFCAYSREHGNNTKTCDRCPGRIVSPRFLCSNGTYHWLGKPAAFLRELERLNDKRLAGKKMT